MKKHKNDILNDSFSKIMLNIGLPLACTYVFTIFTTTFNNSIYSRYIGQIAFSITGVLGVALNLGTSIMSGVASACWIKSAYVYSGNSQKGANKVLVNSVYTLVFVSCMILLFCVLGGNIIFEMMNVSRDLYEEAKEYYYIYIWVYLFSGTAALLKSINTVRGGRLVVTIVNLLPPISELLIVVLLQVVWKVGLRGMAATISVGTLLQIGVNYTLLRKQGIFEKMNKEAWKPDFKLIFDQIKYGLILVIQLLLCSIGEIVVSMQTNRYLSVDYITVIAVNLPLPSLLNIVSSLCTVIVPQNYMAGKTIRVKGFLLRSAVMGITYSVFCFIVFATSGKWYYGILFENAEIVAWGTNYWFWWGLATIPLSFIYIFRNFFDAVGLGKVSLLSGLGELLGRCVCAFWLIPCYGNIGRSLAPLMGWGMAAVLLVIAYIIFRKSIYQKCDGNTVRNCD